MVVALFLRAAVAARRFLRLVYLGPACALLVLHDVVAHDGLVAAGADTNVGDAAAGEFLQAQNVILRLLRELLKSLTVSDVLIPGRHGLKDGLGVMELGLGQRHLIVALTIDVMQDQ